MLLVQESDGLWSIPGGWCEINLSVKENVIKEIKEEAGIDITVEKLIAIHDSNKHYKGMYPYGISTVFFLCKLVEVLKKTTKLLQVVILR